MPKRAIAELSVEHLRKWQKAMGEVNQEEQKKEEKKPEEKTLRDIAQKKQGEKKKEEKQPEEHDIAQKNFHDKWWADVGARYFERLQAGTLRKEEGSWAYAVRRARMQGLQRPPFDPDRWS